MQIARDSLFTFRTKALLFATIAAFGVFILGCGSDDVTPTGVTGTAPVADFTATPTSGQAGGATTMSVQFTDASTPGSAAITSWNWVFGDGGTSSATNPLYVFKNAGTYTVSLTVTSSAGSNTATKTNYIIATDPGSGTAPVADFTATPRTGEAGGATTMSVQFTDTSIAGSAPITSWSWVFGDGGTSTLADPQHTYASAGSYNVSLTVTSSAGSDTETKAGYVIATEPPDLSALVPGRVAVSLVPNAVEFFEIRATDRDGNPAPISISSSNTSVATATMDGSTRARIDGRGVGITTVSVLSGSMSRSVAIEVYDPMVMESGGLIMTFVDDFLFQWNDAGSGANRDGGFWHPVTTNGFFALGSVALNNYGDPNGKQAVLVVKPSSGSTALAPPIRYDQVWNDSGSGADRDGSFWKPVPPPGYVAMGVVAQAGYGSPGLDEVRCVRQDLVILGNPTGEFVWNDTGSGANADFSCSNIAIPIGAVPTSVAHMAVGSFFGSRASEVNNVLRIPFQTLSEGDPQFYVPKLTSFAQPPKATEQMLAKSILVPFTAISDPAYAGNIAWQVANSPFYRLERSAIYEMQFHYHNQGSVDQPNNRQYTNGVTATDSETYHVNTGVKITAEGSVSALGTGGKVAVEVSVEMGYATTQERAVFMESSTTVSMVTPPGKATALWRKASSFTLFRHDGATMQPVGSPWTIGEDSYIQDEYPD